MQSAEKQEWRDKLRNYQSHHKISWWKFSYAESLLEKSFDFYDVGQSNLGEATLARLSQWLEKHQKATLDIQNSQEDSAPFSNLWSKTHVQEQLFSLRGRMEASRSLIPRLEFEDLLHDVKTLEKKLEDMDLELSEIRTLRVRLIERLSQSLGSLRGMEALKERVKNEIQIDSIGPYNNRYNFSEAFNVISSGDPIWVGDFLDLYRSLFGFEDKVSSTVIKKK